ncbi:MAG: lyase family protein [Gaiellaceae bacterium]
MTTFGPLFVPESFRAAVCDTAWFERMLAAERALARAARAEVDESAFDVSLYPIEDLCAEGRAGGNPVEPLVRALRARAGDGAHRGATSQDVLDTAAMLVARDAVRLVLVELDGACAACARLAETHRSTQMAARTLLQQAVPTTFGYTAARWLAGLIEGRARLHGLRFPAQLGGAAGTLAAFGDGGLDVAARFAAELELDEKLVPWQTDRAPVRALAAALDNAAQACAKIGLDVVLLAQTEVGEVSEHDGGASSTMPHKRNPVRATLARACARAVHAQASLLTAGDYELERAAGAWHAEWNALSQALAFAGGAAAAARGCLESLDVDEERMRSNMSDDLYTEQRAFGVDGDYLGAAEALVDRVLERYRA